MRIAFLTDGIYPYVIGGMQQHSYNVLKQLIKNGVKVDLFHFTQTSNHNPKNLGYFSQEENHLINNNLLEFPKHSKLPGHYIRESYAYSCEIFNKIKHKLDEYNFIYAKGFGAWKLIEEKKKGLNTPPIGVNFHGYEMFQKSASKKSWLESMFLNSPVKFNTLNADYVFSYGGKITSIIQALGVASEQILEFPSGIDQDSIRSQVGEENTKIKFAFLGRYERRKGIEELNNVVKNLAGSNFEFHFIGPIDAKCQLHMNNTIYYGKVMDRAKLFSILDKCDVLVCPSHSEGMPNVIIEGMARGLAIIATDVGAVSCLVSEKNGWLLPGCSEEGIEAVICEAIELKPEQLQLKKQASIQLVKQSFLWKKIGKNLVDKLIEITQ